MNHICFNGKMMPADEAFLPASGQGFRFGDGLFETMKFVRGRIQLEAFHLERLFAGLALLKFEIPAEFTAESLRYEIEELCKKNGCEELGRVRLSVSRGKGELSGTGNEPQWLVESWTLDPSFNELNEQGLLIGVFPEARKSCDPFSNLKSTSRLSYTMAGIYAAENHWDDCLVLNERNNIADSTIANIFIIKDGLIRSPGLEEGCVNGVMRRSLVERLLGDSYRFREEALSPEDIEDADEVFLTNAIRGIRWVGQFGNKKYSNKTTIELFEKFIRRIE